MLIDCVYKCGEQFLRREIHEHELEGCPRRPIEVQISSLARKLEGTRIENQFLKKDLSEKLNAVITENKVIKAENQAIKAENQAIKAENKALQETVKQLQSSCTLLKSCVNPTPPFYFTLRNVKHHMQKDLSWMSPPFYSHAGGYKMCIVVFANGLGSGKGTHLSLLIGIMRGEYDDQLQWPFRGKVIIQTCMHSEKWGSDTTLTFDDTVPYERRGRPLGCVCNRPWGFQKFINRDQLQFYDENIRFRVSSVEL